MAWPDRFWAAVSEDDRGCWVWVRCVNNYGYGVVNAPEGIKLSHRVSFAILREEPIDGKVLDHVCRNRRCVNPDHLDPTTHVENTLRGESPAARNARKTHLIPAYGRDYKSKAAVLEAWNAGKDFIIANAFDPCDGKPCNIESARAAGWKNVNIRYKGLRNIAVIKVQ